MQKIKVFPEKFLRGQQSRRKIELFIGTNMFQIIDYFVVQSFCHLVAFGKFTFQNLVKNQLFRWEFYVLQQDGFCFHQDCEQYHFLQTVALIFLVCPSDTRKSQTISNWLIFGFLHQEIDKKFLFYQHYQALHDVLQKNGWKGLCSRCIFWVCRFVKNKRFEVPVIVW